MARKHRFEIEVIDGDAPVRGGGPQQQRYGRWFFNKSIFAIPMGYAVPDAPNHIRLPERAREEGVRDFHCTIIVNCNSVRIDMVPDALVYVDDSPVRDLEYILVEKNECTLRLGQRQGFAGSPNPTFRLRLHRDRYDPSQGDRHTISDLTKALSFGRRGGSVGIANRLWDQRHILRWVAVLLGVGLIALAFYAFLNHKANERRDTAFDTTVEVLTTLETRQPLSRTSFQNANQMSAAVRPVIAVTELQSGDRLVRLIGTVWLCCEDSPRAYWVTNKHVIDQVDEAVGTGETVAIALPGFDADTNVTDQYLYVIGENGKTLIAPSTHPYHEGLDWMIQRRTEELRENQIEGLPALINVFDIAVFPAEVPESAVPLRLANPDSILGADADGMPLFNLQYAGDGPLWTQQGFRDASPMPNPMRLKSKLSYNLIPPRGENALVAEGLLLLVDGEARAGQSGSPIFVPGDQGQAEVIAILGQSLNTPVLAFNESLVTLQAKAMAGQVVGLNFADLQAIRLPVGDSAGYAFRADLIREVIACDLERTPDIETTSLYACPDGGLSSELARTPTGSPSTIVEQIIDDWVQDNHLTNCPRNSPPPLTERRLMTERPLELRETGDGWLGRALLEHGPGDRLVIIHAPASTRIEAGLARSGEEDPSRVSREMPSTSGLGNIALITVPYNIKGEIVVTVRGSRQTSVTVEWMTLQCSDLAAEGS